MGRNKPFYVAVLGVLAVRRRASVKLNPAGFLKSGATLEAAAEGAFDASHPADCQQQCEKLAAEFYFFHP